MISTTLVVLSVLGTAEQVRAQVNASTGSGAWSNPSVWTAGVPKDGDRVAIRAGDTISLDRNSRKLRSLEVSGILRADRDTLFIDSSFYGSGTFSPGAGTVAFLSSDTVRLEGSSISNFFNLTLGDSQSVSGARVINKRLRIDGRFEADFRKRDSIGISGSAEIEVGGDLVYVGTSAADWTGIVRLIDRDIDTAWLVVASTRDTLFAFPQIVIAKRDTMQFVRAGHDNRNRYPQFGDTLYASSRAVLDTAIIVKSGTLDLVRGHIRATDSLLSPRVFVGRDARFRTGTRGELDTAFMARFMLDTNSTFEFYADSVKDVTYALQSFEQPHYWHLWLSAPTLTGLKTQDLEINGNLLLQNGAEINPRAGTGLHKNARIVIHGDVINQSRGHSGSVGSGSGGGDGHSPLAEHWIFDKPGDTLHWSGPSELQRVTVTDGTILSVRFIDHDNCDSLLFIDSITEEGGNCGGRVIGKIYTMPYRFFQLSERTHDFGNIGLTITSGEPFLQHTRVVRYAGYLPPGERIGIQPERTVKRYFQVIPGDGPQTITPNTIEFKLHCDDVNGVDLSNAVFWRSTSDGHSWAYSGITHSDPDGLSFVRDTTAVGFPHGSNNFLWTLSTQRDDLATPVLLESFDLQRELADVHVTWKTNSEIDVRGFAIERTYEGRTDRIRSCVDEPELLSRSRFGAEYSIDDPVSQDGLYAYALIEISLDGLERVLGRKTIQVKDIVGATGITVVPTRAGNKVGLRINGELPEEMTAQVFDLSGRSILGQTLRKSQDPVLDLELAGMASQMIFLRLSSPGRDILLKVLLPAF
ncbi:MAG TPA: G8 domain-containing protein [Candidatus Kapabacteria bacterium]|nr:G8 domain-containing protein [Candidatus Kapabacteria bacterium]